MPEHHTASVTVCVWLYTYSSAVTLLMEAGMDPDNWLFTADRSLLAQMHRVHEGGGITHITTPDVHHVGRGNLNMMTNMNRKGMEDSALEVGN